MITRRQMLEGILHGIRKDRFVEMTEDKALSCWEVVHCLMSSIIGYRRTRHNGRTARGEVSPTEGRDREYARPDALEYQFGPLSQTPPSILCTCFIPSNKNAKISNPSNPDIKRLFLSPPPPFFWHVSRHIDLIGCLSSQSDSFSNKEEFSSNIFWQMGPFSLLHPCMLIYFKFASILGIPMETNRFLAHYILQAGFRSWKQWPMSPRVLV